MPLPSPRPTPLLALLFVAGPPRTHAASFPCTAAHTPQEKTICAAAYKQLRTQLSPTAAAEVQSDSARVAPLA